MVNCCYICPIIYQTGGSKWACHVGGARQIDLWIRLLPSEDQDLLSVLILREITEKRQVHN